MPAISRQRSHSPMHTPAGPAAQAALAGPGNAFMASQLAPQRGGGEELPFLDEMEAAFGEDFGGVGFSLGEDLEGLGANATAQGKEVSFAEANPSKETVAHELAHVVQQRRYGEASGEGTTSPDEAAEVEAARVGKQAASGQPVQVGARPGRGVHREVAPAATETQAESPDLTSLPRFDGSLGLGPWEVGGPQANLSVGGELWAWVLPEPLEGSGDEFLLATGFELSAIAGAKLALEKVFHVKDAYGVQQPAVGLGADVALDARVHAKVELKKKRSVADWQQAAEAIEALQGGFDALNSAFDSAASIQDLEQIPQLLQEFHRAGRSLEALSGMGEQLAKLVEALQQGKDQIVSTLQGAAESIGGEAEVIRSLGEDEVFEMVVEGGASAGFGGSADVQGGGVSGSEQDSQWMSRSVRAEGLEGDDVAVRVGVGSEMSSEGSVGGSASGVTVTSSSGETVSQDAALNVHMSRDDGDLDDVVDAGSTAELFELTREESLEDDLRSLEFGEQSGGHTSASTERGPLSVQGGTDFTGETYFRFNYETGQLEEVRVAAAASDSVSVGVGGISVRPFGTDEVKWEYDGEYATFAPDLPAALGELSFHFDRRSLLGLRTRAMAASEWESIAGYTASAGHMSEWMDAWRAFGRDLRRAGTDDFRIKLITPTGEGLRLHSSEGPMVPAGARRDWTAYCVARAVYDMTESNKGGVAAQTLQNAMSMARGMFIVDGMPVGTAGGIFFDEDTGDAYNAEDILHALDVELTLRGELQEQVDVARERQQAALEQQLADEAALVEAPDGELLRRSEEHLAVLDAILGALGHHTAVSKDEARNQNMLVVQQASSFLASARARYLKAFGQHVELRGYGQYGQAGVEMDAEAQATIDDEWRRSASQVAHSLAALDGTAERYLQAGIDLTDSRATRRMDTSLKAWTDLRDAHFLPLVRQGVERPDLDQCTEIEWIDATTGSRHEQLLQRYKHLLRTDGYEFRSDAQLADYMQDPDVASGPGELAELESPEPGFDPASPEHFEFNEPTPPGWTERNDYFELDRSQRLSVGPGAVDAIKDGGAAKLTEWAGRILEYLSAAGTTVPFTAFRIDGTTDLTDSQAYNWELGYRRALAVRQFLVNAGVPAVLLYVSSSGEARADQSADSTAHDANVVDRRAEGPVEEDASIAQMMGTETPTVGDDAAVREEDREAVSQEQLRAELIGIHIGGWQLTTLTLLVHLLGEAGARSILGGPTAGAVRAFDAAAAERGLRDRSLPVNEHALAGAPRVEFQPPHIKTDFFDDSAEVKVRVRWIDGLDVGQHLGSKGTSKGMLGMAVAQWLEARGGVCLHDDTGQAIQVEDLSWDTSLDYEGELTAAGSEGEAWLESLEAGERRVWARAGAGAALSSLG